MKKLITICVVMMLAIAPQVFAGSSVINLGGSGSITADFTINYQPLGTGSYVDNVFPDNENYTFSIGSGLTDYQSNGRGMGYVFDPVSGLYNGWHSDNGNGIDPWVYGLWAGQTYLPTGSSPNYGVVRTDAQWTINYFGEYNPETIMRHTILAGTVSNFVDGGGGGISTALLTVYDTAYRGYGTTPGLDTYSGGAYQGFDMNREDSGRLAMGQYLYTWNGTTNTGTLNPVPEPATICLLGLGALSLLRRKR